MGMEGYLMWKWLVDAWTRRLFPLPIFFHYFCPPLFPSFLHLCFLEPRFDYSTLYI